jgi:hypothetical protein
MIKSEEDYQKLKKSNLPQSSLSEALMTPIIEQDLDFSRDRDTGRDIAKILLTNQQYLSIKN